MRWPCKAAWVFSFILGLCTAPAWTSTASTNIIRFGQVMTGSITNSGQADCYGFTVAAFEVVHLALAWNGSPGASPLLDIQDPNQVRVFSRPGAGWPTAVDRLVLSNGGSYTIAVHADDLTGWVDYQLCLVRSAGRNLSDPGDGPERLVPGDVCQAGTAPADLDFFTFPAIAGDSVCIGAQVISGSAGNPWVRLLAPDGTELATAGQGGLAQLQVRCLPRAGIYQVVVGNGGFGESFDYRLRLVQWPIVPAGTATSPYLAVYQCEDGHVFLRWPTNAAGFKLLTASDVEPCTSQDLGTPPLTTVCYPAWVEATDIVPYILDAHYYADLGAASQTRFYRLFKTGG